MKKILTAVFFAGALLSSYFALAQDNAAPPPPAAPAQPAAPASGEAMPSWLEYKPSYTGEENDIANPHRTTEEMASWAQQAAADVLTFSQDNYDMKMSGFKKYFIKQGWDLYIAYLKNQQILKMINENGYSMGAIVSDVPEVVHSGATNGAYHWIIRMPITISFFKKDPASGDTKMGPTGKFYLFIDVVRVMEGGGDDGIAITNWRVMDVPKN